MEKSILFLIVCLVAIPVTALCNPMGTPGTDGRSYTLDNLPYSEKCDQGDVDCDGLLDRAEDALSKAFSPYLVFDDKEACSDGTVFLYQLTPISGRELVLAMVALYKEDCPSQKLRRHAGDSQKIRFTLSSQDGRKWMISKVEYNQHTASGLPLRGPHEWTPVLRDRMRHIILYVSRNKHWFYPTVEACHKARHGKAQYKEYCGSSHAKDKILVKFGSIYDGAKNRFSGNLNGNVGEPPYAYRIYSLDHYGFRGENIHDGRCFCGGGKRSNRCKAVHPHPKPAKCANPVSSKFISEANSLLPASPKSFVKILRIGTKWSVGTYATSVTFGELDGDRKKELVVGLKGKGARLLVYDHTPDGFRLVLEYGKEWGSNAYVSDVATGDVDGDGRDEIIIARYISAKKKYPRWIVLDDMRNNFRHIKSESSWGASIKASAIAAGDIDGDGRDEIVVGRRYPKHEKKKTRLIFYDDKLNNFKKLHEYGQNWGSSSYPTSIAIGDIDADGIDEIVVGRWKESKQPAYFVFDDAKKRFRVLNSRGPNGKEWGEDNYVTDVAVGDVDGDRKAEVGILRKTRNIAYRSPKIFLFEFRRTIQNIRIYHIGGSHWGKNTYGTAIAFGNIDQDRALEIGFGRQAGRNVRCWFTDDKVQFGKAYTNFCEDWPAHRYLNDIAFGDVDGDGKQEAALAVHDTKTKYIKLQVLKF